MGKCKPRVDLAYFDDIRDFKGVPVLLDYSGSIAITSAYKLMDVVGALGVKRIEPPEFLYIHDWDTGYICLKDDPGTCYRLDAVRGLCVDLSEAYAAKDKPLVARIGSTNWYAIIAPTSLK